MTSVALLVIDVVATVSAALAVVLNGVYIARHLRNWRHSYQTHIVAISTIIGVRTPARALKAWS